MFLGVAGWNGVAYKTWIVFGEGHKVRKHPEAVASDARLMPSLTDSDEPN